MKRANLLRAAIAIALIIAVGCSAFFVAGSIPRVRKNTTAIMDGCRLSNEQVQLANEKFGQLVLLFDTAMKERSPDRPPPSKEVLALYEKFRRPIPLKDCTNLSKL